MASPIEVIRQGIQENDWKKVVQGYNRLSGEKLKVPKTKANIVVEIQPRDVPARVREQIERPFAEAIHDAIRRLTDALDSDSEQDEEAGNPIPPAADAEEDEILSDSDMDAEIDPEEESSPFDDRGEETDEESEKNAHPEGSDEARAAQARAILRGERSLPDFTHVHTGTPDSGEHSDLGRKCRTEPVRPGNFKNTFKDDGRLFQSDARVDKKLTKGLRPSRRRPPVRKVKVTCFKCGKKYLVEPSFAPKIITTMDGTNETTTYVCDACMRRTAS